ncbi:prepilin-type N-terminal cleavage/methylation domain-containing protein [Pseudomonas sp. BIGb0427]|uniref:prepilin-type N-terminal cleavage/methylation domain-containing protein n=1 Tax=unclassified Pseudomonas TaxID=196821 RepID=UPI0018A6EA08|nr:MULTISPECIES: prepilin-type N-terminal cleavage/methylation domain-containing protein [unclassified Pseudomonas]QPG65520.1 prepilin-type N-terminal cleavage/methylation domain-containing protein [Pseudomonas sp. BIGb0427]UVM67966.1 type II secretion system protein GspJ [Pseudomonas sp. B21-009]
MKRRQQGLTLLELLVALALTAVLGILLAALVNAWAGMRERLQQPAQGSPVLDFCLALERRFDSTVLRQLYEQRLPLAINWLDWQPATLQLQWVARSAWPQAEGGSRLQRQRLSYDTRGQRLLLETSSDLYAVGKPQWRQREQLDQVTAPSVAFFQSGRWLAFPSAERSAPDRGVRLEFKRDGAPYVCTFALPEAP